MPHAVRAPRGTTRSGKGWIQEAALRMLQNNLDPEVAEKPDELVVYGGSGKAARDWPSYERICACLRTLDGDETLLVQTGKPVGVLRTHPDAPRVLIANSNLVPKWATWEKFRELERAGLTMYGQMTAGSWIYIGTQGILQGTYETFMAAGRRHFGSEDLSGRLVVSSGLGGMGGAQPLAAAMAGAVFLGFEVDPQRLRRRLAQRYLDEEAPSLEAALRRAAQARDRGEAISIGVVMNAAEAVPELARRGVVPDLLTDQTSAHDPLNGYVPAGLTVEQAAELRARDEKEYVRRARASMAEFPGKPALHLWLRLARERVQFQGLPARICWLGYGERARAGLVFNELVRSGRVKAPLVIGRDHLDCGSVASPNRETEAMKDG